MSIKLTKTLLENNTKLIGDVDGVRLKRHVQKVGPPQYPGAMNAINNFRDDYLPVTSVDAIGVVQNFDLLNIRNPYCK